jgi:hypothetical protein
MFQDLVSTPQPPADFPIERSAKCKMEGDVRLLAGVRSKASRLASAASGAPVKLEWFAIEFTSTCIHIASPDEPSVTICFIYRKLPEAAVPVTDDLEKGALALIELAQGMSIETSNAAKAASPKPPTHAWKPTVYLSGDSIREQQQQFSSLMPSFPSALSAAASSDGSFGAIFDYLGDELVENDGLTDGSQSSRRDD